jgi:preprotein translocase subunit SecD
MARQQRPGRTLLVFLALIGVMFGLVALAGTWKPRLGLDLQGGTRITLVTVGETTEASLAEAAGIIDQRVNGSGVTESEVTTQGDSIIVVEIPGKSRRDLEETVKRQAQMRFRLVALTDNGITSNPTTPTESIPAEPGTGVLAPSESPSDGESEPAQPNNRPALTADEDEDGAAKAPDPSIDKPLEWAKSPDADSVAAYEAFECPPPGETPIVDDDPDLPLVTCDDQGVKFLLSKAMIEGTDLRSADSGLVDFGYVVNIAFKGEATKTFTTISQDLVGTERQFAIVLDGTVISAPTMEGVITDGRAQISGNFTQESAQGLATSLKFGALPVSFNEDINVQTVGASLAGNQLEAGIWAGALGLLLVMIYCVFYYRGLGFVVIGSLFVAAALTYALVLLLSESAGFALTLPGIAGLIVAVGITADSFVVFFERIRDEMRDGKSMRIAVESGWVRARNTCLAADAVSLLAAVVLFIFAAGVVKGFAFALGISTLIDLVVFFWFTKPMVSWLGQYRFFNTGHRFSGLSAETLGVDDIHIPATVGGRA